MKKKIAILQSNYIPWKGYFDLIAYVDEFILYDEVQYTRRDWRNRNKIKTPDGVRWLTVPVVVRGKYLQKISETEINGQDWSVTHWRSLYQNYARALYFNEVASWLEPLYIGEEYSYLASLNRKIIQSVCNYLGIRTRITTSSEYSLCEGRSERLLSLCMQAGGDEYVSGPAARSYIDEGTFADSGVKLTWFNYENYPQYPQLWGEFVHEVSILDLLFNCGRDGIRYMNHVK
jgi:hypothetical protein